MKKLILIIILIVLFSSYLVYGKEEIIEKSGNTTKIKLLDDDELNNTKSKLYENVNINEDKNNNNKDIEISIEKIPKLDIVINNADKTFDYSNLEENINLKLNELGIDTSDTIYYKRNIERYIFDDYINKNEIDNELLNIGVSTPSNIATFSNTIYKEEELTYLDLEDLEPDNIEHACSFVTASNDKYHWEYCSICGESAELLKTLNNNNETKPTDNNDNTKGNINIEEHNYILSRVVNHTPYNHCNDCYIYGFCSCGKYGCFGTTYSTGYGRNSGCIGCNYNHTYGTTKTTITWHGSVAQYIKCTRCGNPINAGNNGCQSNKRHYMLLPTEINQIRTCNCNQCSFKCLEYEWTIDKTNKKIVLKTKQETNRNDATFNSTTRYSEEYSDPAYASPTNVTVSNQLITSSNGKYIYEYTFNISFAETTPIYSYMRFIRELNTTNGFMVSMDTGFNVTEFTSPTIINIASTSMALKTDEKGNTWITQKQYIINGTENSYSTTLKIEDMYGNIYFNGTCIKDGNNWSISFTPYIEANVKKTLKAIAIDGSGNESEPYYFNIDTTDCKSPQIISNLDYRNEWKNKIIYKAEAYEGGIGLTQIALNKNSDFRFVNKIENPDKSGNDIYYRFYVFEGDIYGDDIITPTLFARDGLNHLDTKKILIGKLDSTKPTIENININNNQIEIIANDNHITKGEGSGIKAYSVVPIGKNPTLSSFKFNENIQIDYSGNYDVYAIDNAGNVSNKYPISINIDDDATNKLRDDAIKVFNYIDDEINNIFKNDSYIANNICIYDGNFIWLTENNKSFYQNYISYLDGNSLEDYTHYKDNSINYDTAIKNTAIYIKKLIDNEYNENYYILDSKFKINVNPLEKINNQVSIEYPNGMYYINHNFIYFDNSLGECDNTNCYIKDLYCDFNKVGKFDIRYCDKTITDLYIHRKPLINFDIDNNNGNINIINKTFDLDNNVDKGYGKGIKEEKWYWKYPTDTTWHNEKLSKYDKDKIILIKLEVKDNQNYKTKLIKILGLSDIIASFNIERQQVIKGGKIKAFDTSYDSNGRKINKWNYELKKNNILIATSNEANPIFNSNELDLGTYTLFLQVENELLDKSNTFSKQLTIIEDLDKPYFIANPPNCRETRKQKIELEFYDIGSGVKHYKYTFTNTKELAENGYTEWIEKDKDTIYTPNKYGIYYLSIIVEDNKGNSLRKYIGAYIIYNEYMDDSDNNIYEKETVKNDLIEKIENEEPVIPINQKYIKKKRKKDIIDMITEIYEDWKDQNNIKNKNNYDIIEFIKSIYKDFENNNK